MLARLLCREGHELGRLRVRTLMRRMGVEALYRKPNTSRRNAKHKIWPHLLRGLKIERANQVWALDTTYIPMARGFVYLTAVVDWARRKVLTHRVAITLGAVHAVDALEEAFSRYGLPGIVNADQGSQFTAGTFTEAVLGRGIRLSMDGKGCWRDNVFVERVWRSIKYERSWLVPKSDRRLQAAHTQPASQPFPGTPFTFLIRLRPSIKARKGASMLRHIVMWKLKETAEGADRAENAQKLKATLETCRSIVQGQGHFEVGIGLGLPASTFDVVLVSDFDDSAALDSYQNHPKHVAIKAFVGAVTEGRQCVDYEV
ncbi:stress responsive alpha-beta barrel domain-containing protein [Caballeronia telluris]|uniref:Stress responsive alpha-beta barrel domain-containing protein n=2 Tax=Caballeronia telluris TaxID=326475 RepID=A0A158ICF1_9BURK|nr:stress responsive alpha-beta barrel domain-containing protein [Caballeronia telluris]